MKLSSKQKAELHYSMLELLLDKQYEDPNYVEPTDWGEYLDSCADNDFAYEPGQGI